MILAPKSSGLGNVVDFWLATLPMALPPIFSLFLTQLGNFKQKIFWRQCHWQCCQAKVCSIVKGRWFVPLLFLYHIKIGTCLLVTITVPMLFSPKTNFSPAAIDSQCLKCSDRPNLSIVRNQPNQTFQPFFVRNYRTEPNWTLARVRSITTEMGNWWCKMI